MVSTDRYRVRGKNPIALGYYDPDGEEMPPYEFQEYPKFKYHAKKKPILVNSHDEESRLPKGWEDSPAAHGVVTVPSERQLMAQELGVDIEDDEDPTNQDEVETSLENADDDGEDGDDGEESDEDEDPTTNDASQLTPRRRR